jgi:hypothetical protein
MQTRLSTSSLNPTGYPGRGSSDCAVVGEIAAPRDEADRPAEHAALPRLFRMRRRISRTA